MGTGMGDVSGVRRTVLVCSVLSGLAAIGIIANFDELTAQIAVLVADVLSSGLLILAAVIAVVYFVVRLKWKLYTGFWRW